MIIATDATNEILEKSEDEFETIGKYVACKLWSRKQKLYIAEHVCNAVLCYSLQNKLKDFFIEGIPLCFIDC